MYNKHISKYICISIYTHIYIIVRNTLYIYECTTTLNERRDYKFKREQGYLWEGVEAEKQNREDVITLSSQNIKEVIQTKIKKVLFELFSVFLFSHLHTLYNNTCSLRHKLGYKRKKQI